MNKPITSNKFVTDLWGVVQMAIEEAVLAEREACAKVCDALHYEVDAYGAQCATAIRARGEKA